ncbi:large ribosomal subunit protein mL42 [Eubalaena glacialis]|uniref:large ribosomal subunit protein mL42 n=1 Tax=Eubalaena glacialis TaxID=27606 RepID=UPI002A5A3293|nr:large ribosomal subunit protein mL42 [Eubalaena glacialis]XP_061061424.1 large ribosomal subunit protein mL42 [Eubalaena glacialis]XP_061061426.1 large ribosomal subunit protein mL42 [Eubalaena glacialis]XP_061061427.1 large ribosomal subunit protein mL42 [Eubalaena glacialis]XP_061061428.1 large ribosomal subunit protein mL42 [Eubalaena glacialis]XP_061061429.1 large ribosomal subunit protein mL42 [Eubalaena glacialis]XP_061061430.1 large ribosomal subunit protein mL42 [Eubalaena glaciali
MALAAVKWAISSRTILKHLFPIQNGALYCVCHKTTYSSLPDDYNCKVELALTSDGRTIVCYHPSVDIPYEHTKPIPRPDPVQNNEETHDLVLKTRLEEKGEHLEQGPMIEQLSKMFFTTKHRWYPRGHLSFRSKLQQQLPSFPIKVKSWKYFCLIKQPQFQRDTQTEHLPLVDVITAT